MTKTNSLLQTSCQTILMTKTNSHLPTSCQIKLMTKTNPNLQTSCQTILMTKRNSHLQTSLQNKLMTKSNVYLPESCQTCSQNQIDNKSEAKPAEKTNQNNFTPNSSLQIFGILSNPNSGQTNLFFVFWGVNCQTKLAPLTIYTTPNEKTLDDKTQKCLKL